MSTFKDYIQAIEKWSNIYQFSFQFWGKGNNNVYIYKDHIEIYDSGGHETPMRAINDALQYIKRINQANTPLTHVPSRYHYDKGCRCSGCKIKASEFRKKQKIKKLAK